MKHAAPRAGRVTAFVAVALVAACAVQKSAPRESTTASKHPESGGDKKMEAPAPPPPAPPGGVPEDAPGTGTPPPSDPSKQPVAAPPTTTAPPPVTPPPTTTAAPPKKPEPNVPTAVPGPPPATPGPGVKPSPDPGVSNVGVAQTRFDDAHAAFVQASGCPAMCKALDSLKNATAHLCALSKSTEPKRCGDAQAKLQKAEAKVKSVCGGCGS